MLLFTFIAQKLRRHLVGYLHFSNTLQNLFYNYVTSLQNIHPITFRKYTKQPIKVLLKKIKMFFQEGVNKQLVL